MRSTPFAEKMKNLPPATEDFNVPRRGGGSAHPPAFSGREASQPSPGTAGPSNRSNDPIKMKYHWVARTKSRLLRLKVRTDS